MNDDASNNTLDGGNGSDSLLGSTGADNFIGGAGDDTIRGGGHPGGTDDDTAF